MAAPSEPSAARRLGGLIAGLLLAACSEAPAPPVGERPALVVWVEVDTLRADALGVFGAPPAADGTPRTPAVDALAAEGVTFEACYATAPWTIPSLVSQLTGRYPFDHGATRLLEPLPPELVTLPEVLRADGWRTAGVGTNFVATGRLGFAQGFELWDDGLAEGHEGSTGGAAVERLLGQLDAFGRPTPDAPVFLFTLLFEPHFRYVAHPGPRFGPDYDGPLTGAEELAELRARQAAGELTEADLGFLRTRYAGEVAAVDRAVGALRAGLEARGLWDEALVVFTADHGEELGERGWIGHTTSLSEALVRVPLIVRPPASWGLAGGRRVSTPVSQVDLARTLLDLARVSEGRRGPHLGGEGSFAALLSGPAAPPRRYLYLHTHFEPPLERSAPKRAHRFGVVDAVTHTKWVVDHQVGERERPRGALHALDADPRGELDLSQDGRLPAEQAHLARLRGLLTEPLRGRDGGEPVPAPEPPADPRSASEGRRP